VQVIHVRDESSIAEAESVAPLVDAILLDSGNPTPSGSDLKSFGGTGKTHNWALSKIICDKVNVPVFLAGGLNADNIAEAMRFVRPFGVDLCSSVRTFFSQETANGSARDPSQPALAPSQYRTSLDPVKLSRFFRAIDSNSADVGKAKL